MALLERSSVAFILYFLKAYPVRTSLMIALLVLGSVVEGVGLLTLLPLLDIAAGSSGAEQSALSQSIAETIRSLGVEPTLGSMLVVIVIAMSLKGALIWLAMRQVGYTIAQVGTDLRLQLMRALLKAEWSYFAGYPTGHFTNAISTEANRATQAYQHGCRSIAQAVQAVIYAIVVFMISWQIAVLALLVGGGLMLLLRRFIAMNRAAGQATTEVMKSLVARLTEAVPGIKPIKAMAREEHLLPLLEDEAEEYNRAQRQRVLAAESMNSIREPLLVAVIAIGLYTALTWGTQSISAILVMVVLSYRLMQTAGHIQSAYQDMVNGESALWSIKRYIDEAEAVREVSTGTRRPPALEKGIRLENVTFRYGDAPVLSDVSVTFPAGKFVAVVGPSGAGKTTLVDLALGLLRPVDGTVFVDDVPLPDIEMTAWRSMIGYVPQEVLLFHGSVFHNVTLGDHSVERTHVEEVLKAAGAWDFVMKLENGLDEVVGERGSKLSGGQRQRIAIARALLGNPKLLVLDEGTAALDPETEAEISESIARLSGDVTVIAISHQMAMSAGADIVYRVSDGKVQLVRPQRDRDEPKQAPAAR